MRICLLGDFNPTLNEGMRNTAFYLYRELTRDNDVLRLDINHPLSSVFGKSVSQFHPQVIQYLSGPSLKSLALLKLVSMQTTNAKTLVLATHPQLIFYARFLLPILKPDLVLAMCQEDKDLFHRYGCGTAFLPIGVDLQRFTPASRENRRALRNKYGLPLDRFIILHIGPVTEMRGIRLLGRLQNQENQVLVVGSGFKRTDKKLVKALKTMGCRVWLEYMPRIEEIYALSDCYVFPAKHALACVRLPLSVLEAMACNLPVITTEFGALPDVFSPDEGFIFASSEKDFKNGLERVKADGAVRNREKVSPLSWERITARLLDIYEALADAKY